MSLIQKLLQIQFYTFVSYYIFLNFALINIVHQYIYIGQKFAEDREKIIDDLKDVVQKNCEIDIKLSMIQEIKEDILSQYNDIKITEKSIEKIIKVNYYIIY